MSTLIMLVCVGTPVEFAADVVFSDGTLGIGVGDTVVGEYEIVDNSLILSFEIDDKLSFTTDLDRMEICQMAICRAWAEEPILFGVDHRADWISRVDDDLLAWSWLSADGTQATPGFSADVTMIGGVPEPDTLCLAVAAVIVLLFLGVRSGHG